MRLEFQMDVLAADTEERTIEGLVAPYGEVGTIKGGQRVRFKPGALTLARARTPLLVDHDHSNPIGVLAELVDGEAGPLGRFKVDATPAGDTALIQAASGSRGALSIGAASDKGDYTTVDGVIEIDAARIHEVSLVALAAFESAAVTRVAAEAPEEEEQEQEEQEEEPDPNQTELPVADPEQEGIMQESSAGAPVIIAARQDAPPRELCAGEAVSLLIRAQLGESEARRYLEAALTETISTDVTGLLPPTYQSDLLGGKQVDRPLYNAFRGRPLPGVGLQINKPKWTTPPVGAWAANVDADATTAKVVVGVQAATVQRWDFATAISWVVVQRSDPGIIDAIYAEAVQDFYLKVEAKIGGQLTPAAVSTATKLGAMIAEFYTATGNQRTPDVIIMAPDVWGKFADVGQLSTPNAAGGVSTGGGTLSTMFAGIPVVVSGTLAAGTTVLATRRAVDARITEPVQLTANAIGALNVELAVVGEGLFDTDYPAELLKSAAIVPTDATP